MTAKTEAPPVKVALIEDHQMIREWLGRMISEIPGFTVCGEADNVHDAFAIICETRPDLVILDISLRGSNGLELLKELKAQGIKAPVLVLSMHEESHYAERALRAGARGYVTKQAASSTLLQAIQQVLNGEVYLGAKAATPLLERLTDRHAACTGVESLADRELEVFQHIGKGRNGREIAKLLDLDVTTVETYRARIKEKLNLRHAPELYVFAALWAHEHGC